jgi:hypothetical protein
LYTERRFDVNRNIKFILTTVLIITLLAALFSAAMIYIMTSPKAVNTPPPVTETALLDEKI